jgi:pimeloyl-ACP methyl ester carboxylesterase
MKKKNLFTSLIIVLSLPLISQNNTKDYPTFNKEISVGIGKDSIAAYALIAKGNKLKETIILLHGLPGHEKNFDLAQNLRSRGKNVIIFNYRGSWGSQGTYSYSNCLEDIGFVLDYFSDSTISSKMLIDTSRFVLIGHSLGGGLALIFGANDNRIKKIITLSAFNIGHRLKRFSSPDSLYTFKNYVNTLFMLNCDSKVFIKEVYENRVKYDVLEYNLPLKEKKVLVIDDFDRSEGWPGELKNSIKYKVIRSDHSFTDKRKKLIRHVNRWLKNN